MKSLFGIFVLTLFTTTCFGAGLKREMKAVTRNKAYEIDHQPMIDSIQREIRSNMRNNPYAESLSKAAADLVQKINCDLQFTGKDSVVIETDIVGEGVTYTLPYLIDSNKITIKLPDSKDFVLRYNPDEKILFIDSTNLVFKVKE